LYRKSIDGYLRRLCILIACIKEVFITAHRHSHLGYNKISDIIVANFYIP
jgi:hypothetical protein